MFAYDSVSGLKPVGCADVFPDPQGIYEKLEHMHQMEKSRDHDKVLCLWSINKWDLRMRRAVISYDGLYNQYTKLPFYIDETESILYGAGQDCYSKVWKLDTGKLVMSIPPPCQASRDTIPALQFSTHWAGRPGNAGLIMVLRERSRS
nr:hypothetical protein BaRGS_024311 [Batillaria attramentaria]